MPISDDDRHSALVAGAELIDGVTANFKIVERIKVEYPNIPQEVMEYIEVSAVAMQQLSETLIMANEKILEYDDAFDKAIKKNQENG